MSRRYHSAVTIWCKTLSSKKVVFLWLKTFLFIYMYILHILYIYCIYILYIYIVYIFHVCQVNDIALINISLLHLDSFFDLALQGKQTTSILFRKLSFTWILCASRWNCPQKAVTSWITFLSLASSTSHKNFNQID